MRPSRQLQSLSSPANVGGMEIPQILDSILKIQMSAQNIMVVVDELSRKVEKIEQLVTPNNYDVNATYAVVKANEATESVKELRKLYQRFIFALVPTIALAISSLAYAFWR